VIAIGLQLIGAFVVAVFVGLVILGACAWVLAAMRNLMERWER